jgi:signal transduction histidine kinase
VLIPATVAWRRRIPFTAAAAAVALLGVFQQVAFVRNLGLFLLLAIIILVYTVGAQIPGRRAWVAAAIVLALALVAVGTTPTGVGASDYIWAAAFIVGMPFAVGRTLRNRRALTTELGAKAARMEREREERALQAAADERARVARELHDVLAHSVSVMVIQAGAARRIAPVDREASREALRAVQASGREALAELRRMVGVMRRGEPAADTHEPSMEQLHELVARARAAGLPVEVRVEGERTPLPAGVDLAAYRVIQECLTNTIKHAGPAHTRVLVRYADEALEIEVSDTGRGPGASTRPQDGSGHGLVGMRERVALYDGELQAGRRRGGGFTVKARIPLQRSAA